jgi:serine/threonine protein kinase
MSKYFQSERRILERLRHPNVVAYLDFDEDPDQNAFILYTEFCNLGDINTGYGRSRDSDNDDDEDSYYGFYPEAATADSAAKEPLQGQDFWMLVAQLASALTYLHYGLVVKEVGERWASSFERTWIKVLHRDIKPANGESTHYYSDLDGLSLQL